METSKILPIVAGGIGLTVLAVALLSGNKAKKSGVYLDEGSGNNSSIFDAKQVADDLHYAMNKSGTDEDAIFAVLTGVSEAQFASVVLAFGNRKYNTYLGSDTWAINSYPLKVWLQEELSDEYQTLKSKYPKYL